MVSGDDERDPMDPESWYDRPDVCGSCIAWKPSDPQDGETLAAGRCQLRPELPRVPADMRLCSIYKGRGRFKYDASRAGSPRRRRNKVLKVVRVAKDGTETAVRRPKPIPAAYVKADLRGDPRPDLGEVQRRRDRSRPDARVGETRPDVVERPERAPAPNSIDLGQNQSLPVIKQALAEMLRDEFGRTSREMHSKFARGGRVEARTATGEVVSIRAEQFFGMLDRLQSSLSRLDRAVGKVEDGLGPKTAKEMRDQIGRFRGSLTTFNVMFEHKEDHFRSK